MLADKAAEQGAVITQTYAFDPGLAASQDDLTCVEAVVEALGRAIETHADIWLPFPLQDLAREQHWRRLSLALQRHGLNLLMGPEMAPSPIEGGYSAVDAALRDEVRAVDGLDYAALAAAGMKALGTEIEAALLEADEQSSQEPATAAVFSTAEAAGLFGRSDTWISRGLREGVFVYPDGSAVEPLLIGKGGRRQFTVPMLRAIAWSSYRRGNLSREQLEAVLADLNRALR
ncbi:MAG: hypothetical protein ACOYEV_06820 [Candidatus Nanopelagicales bacterium]